MILGVGTDLKWKLTASGRPVSGILCGAHIYGTGTPAGGDKISRFAGSFAVKEVVAKALGTGFRAFMPIDIEVARDDSLESLM